MSGIYAIGNKVYTDDGDRLFAHQFGDGFVIVGDFHEEALDRCVAIAVALMRHIATSGCLARAAVAEGDFADYSGCWPKEIRQRSEAHTSELQSLMRTSYAVFCLKKKKKKIPTASNGTHSQI